MAARTGDWRAALAVCLATAAAPIVAIMGIGAIVEPESPKLLGLMLLPGLALLAWLVLRQRRTFTTIVAGGILGGWTLGIGIRIAMFLAAEMGGGVERSLGGTVGLVLFFAFPGIALSGVALVVRAFRPIGPRGVALLVTVVCAAFLAGPVRGELFARGNGWVNLVTFLLAAAAGGYVTGRVQLAVEGWWDRRAAHSAPLAAASTT